MLTPERIQELRAKAGIPAEGYGTVIPADQRIAELRAASGYNAPQKGSAGQTLLPHSNLADNLKRIPGDAKKLATESPTLPLLGALGGGAFGAFVGAPAGPFGSLAGASAGAGAGAAAGSAAQQALKDGTVDPMEAGKTGLEFAALEAAGGPLAFLAKSIIKPAGEAIAKFFIPLSKREAQAIQNYHAGNTLAERSASLFKTGETAGPTTAADTAFQKGIFGTESQIGVQATRAKEKLWNDILSPALSGSELKVEMPTFFKAVEQQIIKDNVEPTRQKALLEALEAMKADYTEIGSVSLARLQQFKEGWAKFVPDKAYQGKPIAGAFRDVQNIAADNARTLLYEALGPQIRQAYIDYGNLKALQELGQAAMTGAKFKGGAGGFVSGLYEMATVPIGTIGGHTVYKVGDLVEMIGAPGARILRDLIGVAAGFGTPTSQDNISPLAPTPRPMPQSTPKAI